MRKRIKGWLEAGVVDNDAFTPTEAGTPQGGVISPLLANIALHGLEEACQSVKTGKEKPVLIRYADDFVVLHSKREVVENCAERVKEFLNDMGLWLNEKKTRMTHTLHEVDGNKGFHFLGYHVRQYPVGKYHTGYCLTWYSIGLQDTYQTIRRSGKKTYGRNRQNDKEKGNRSPYDGDITYWSRRLSNHPMLKGKLGKLLEKQKGKCRWCNLYFWGSDAVEIDHITPKSLGGGDDMSNLMALHRHCHDEKHSKRLKVIEKLAKLQSDTD